MMTSSKFPQKAMSSTLFKYFCEMLPILRSGLLLLVWSLCSRAQLVTNSTSIPSVLTNSSFTNGSSLPPTLIPSVAPLFSSSNVTDTPTAQPSSSVSTQPSQFPSNFNTTNPTTIPTQLPTAAATTLFPTDSPTESPTIAPTVLPSVSPSVSPTQLPTVLPTVSLAPTVSSLCLVDHKEWIHNGLCDIIGEYNTEACGYDGGDCCQSTRSITYNTTNVDPSGSLSIDYCTDPLIIRNASLIFVIGNASVDGLNGVSSMEYLIGLSLREILQIGNTSALISVLVSPSLSHFLDVHMTVSFEAPMVLASRIVANLSSTALQVLLIDEVESGQLQTAFRLTAVRFGLNAYQWTVICSSTDVCEAILPPVSSNSNPESTCSFNDGNWRNFYGWSASEWSASNFPKYFLWLLFQFFLVLWFALCIALCYYQERFFLTRTRKLQIILSIVSAVLMMIYLLMEIFVPGLYSEPKAFSCIEFSFRDTAAGLDYEKATPEDYFYWNPYLASVLMLAYGSLCMEGSLRLQSVEEAVHNLCPRHTSFGGLLYFFRYLLRLQIAMTMLFLPLPIIQLLLYAVSPNIGVYTAIPLTTLAVVWQIVCGVTMLINASHHQLIVAVYELQLTLLQPPQERGKSNSSEMLTTAPADHSEEGSSTCFNGVSNNSSSLCQSSDESGTNNIEENMGTAMVDNPATQEVAVTFRDPELRSLQLMRIVLGVFWIVTAVVDFTDKPVMGLVLYSILLRICLLTVMFLMSYSVDMQLPK